MNSYTDYITIFCHHHAVLTVSLAQFWTWAQFSITENYQLILNSWDVLNTLLRQLPSNYTALLKHPKESEQVTL